MGARLVGLVVAYWGDLPGSAFKVLTRMAVTALDSPTDDTPSGLYFGGHELLVHTLKLHYPSGNDEIAKKARAHSLENVRRTILLLAKRGAVEVVDTGRVVRHGHARTYRLTLERRVKPREIDGAKARQFEGAKPRESEGAKPRENAGLSPVNLTGPGVIEEPSQERSHEKSQESAATVPRGSPSRAELETRLAKYIPDSAA